MESIKTPACNARGGAIGREPRVYPGLPGTGIVGRGLLDFIPVPYLMAKVRLVLCREICAIMEVKRRSGFWMVIDPPDFAGKKW
jgi:hypothetical protein